MSEWKSRSYNNLFKKIYSTPYYVNGSHVNLFNSSKDSKTTFQRLKLLNKLPVHNGCVNSICWSENGEFILSGSDDQRLCITNAYSGQVKTSVQTRHKTNIFSAKFLPNCANNKIVSCSGDGVIIYTDLTRCEENYGNLYNCHFGTAYKIVTVPNDANTFLSCGEDGTVRWYDLRMKQSCNMDGCREDILIDCHRAVSAMAVNPFAPYELAVGCADSYVHVFDRRKMGTRATGNTYGALSNAFLRITVPSFQKRNHRITSLVYSSDASQLLVSYSSEYLYLFGLKGDGRNAFKNGNNTEDTSLPKSPNPPPMKRWRLRGDWSDTGPNARPEREMRGTQQRSSVQSILIRRMSYVLTQILNEPGSSRNTNASSNNNNNESGDDDNRNISTNDETAAFASSSSNIAVTEEEIAASNSAINDIDEEMIENQSMELESQVTNDSDVAETPMEDATVEETTNREENAIATSSSSSSSSIPGREVMQESITSLEKQLSNQRKDFLKRHRVEPVVNLHYSSKGVNSGLISMAKAPSGYPTSSSSSSSEDTSPSSSGTCLTEAAGGGEATAAAASTSTAGRGKRESDSKEDRIDESTSVAEAAAANYVSDSSTDEDLLVASEREEKCSNLSDYGSPFLIRKFCGHRNARTMIKEANFWGEHYVISGSDCGHIFFWDRQTAQVVMILEADHHVVNCVQPHPFDPILASSGIDYDVKLWAPMEEEPNFNEKLAAEIMKRNEVMLEETRDTITVPASFMIRMLASLSSRRTPASRLRNLRSENASN